jgi:hypothetical protein
MKNKVIKECAQHDLNGCICSRCGKKEDVVIMWGKVQEGRHDWESIGLCKKKCRVCGGSAYEHEYKLISGYEYANTDHDVSWGTYACTKCGHAREQ